LTEAALVPHNNTPLSNTAQVSVLRLARRAVQTGAVAAGATLFRLAFLNTQEALYGEPALIAAEVIDGEMLFLGLDGVARLYPESAATQIRGDIIRLLCELGEDIKPSLSASAQGLSDFLFSAGQAAPTRVVVAGRVLTSAPMHALWLTSREEALPAFLFASPLRKCWPEGPTAPSVAHLADPHPDSPLHRLIHASTEVTPDEVDVHLRGDQVTAAAIAALEVGLLVLAVHTQQSHDRLSPCLLLNDGKGGIDRVYPDQLPPLQGQPWVLLGACSSAPSVAMEGRQHALVEGLLSSGARGVVSLAGPVDDEQLRPLSRTLIKKGPLECLAEIVSRWIEQNREKTPPRTWGLLQVH